MTESRSEEIKSRNSRLSKNGPQLRAAMREDARHSWFLIPETLSAFFLSACFIIHFDTHGWF